MSRLAPLIDPLAGENLASMAAGPVGKAGGADGAPAPRRAALADVSNRQGGGGSPMPTGPATAKQQVGGGVAAGRSARASVVARPGRAATDACALHAAAAPALVVLLDATTADPPGPALVMERLAGRSGVEEEAEADAATAAVAVARVAALAAGAARYPVAPLSEVARAQQSLRAFTCLDEQEEAYPRPTSPALASPLDLLLHARTATHSSLDGGLALGHCAASPSSSAAADYGGDSTEDSPALSPNWSTGTALKASSPSSGAPASPSSPTLARALAALDLGACDPAPADFADALADWDAALAGVDGSPGSLPCLDDVDGEWDGAVSPEVQPE